MGSPTDADINQPARLTTHTTHITHHFRRPWGRQPTQASTSPPDLPRIPRISRTIFVARGIANRCRHQPTRPTYHAYHAYHAPFPSPQGSPTDAGINQPARLTTHTTHITHHFRRPWDRRPMQTSTNPPDLPRIPRISRTISVAPGVANRCRHQPTRLTYHAYHAYHAPFPSPVGRQPMQASTNPRGLPRIPRISRTIFVARGSPTDAGINQPRDLPRIPRISRTISVARGSQNPPPPVNQRSKTPQPLIHAGTQPLIHAGTQPFIHAGTQPFIHAGTQPFTRARMTAASRPGGPPAKRQPSPEGLGIKGVR